MSRSGAGPWYRWFPRDFLASSRVQAMTLEERGAYRQLLDFQWQDGSIPDSAPDIGRMLGGVRGKRLARIWAAVRPCFDPVPDAPGRLANARIAAERADADAYAAERAAAGRRGAAARWDAPPTPQPAKPIGSANGSANGSAIKEPMAKNGHAHAHALVATNPNPFSAGAEKGPAAKPPSASSRAGPGKRAARGAGWAAVCEAMAATADLQRRTYAVGPDVAAAVQRAGGWTALGAMPTRDAARAFAAAYRAAQNGHA